MQKRIVYILAGVLVVFLSLNSEIVSAETISSINEKIRKLDEEQSELRQKTKKIDADKQDVNKKMEENKEEQISVQQKLDNIENELVVTRAEIQSVEASISATEKEISELESEIKQLHGEIRELEKRINKRNELLKERLRSIQESGGKSQFISVLLGAQNFTDFIMRTTAVNTIMDQDRSIMEEHAADQLALEQKKSEVEQKKADVEAKRANLEDQKHTLEELKAQLDEQKALQAQLKAQLEKEYAEMENYKMSLEEQQQLIKNQAIALEKAKQLAQQQQAEIIRAEQGNDNQQNNGGTNITPPVSNGAFGWPVSGGSVTSSFGSRWGVFHHGIDIGHPVARNGGDVPVFAAASGVVSRSYYSGSYGNVVFITHYIDGVQYETVYAHMKYTPLVNAFQTVQKGQQIGIIGNTGDSRGPHLHFEVHRGKWNEHKSNAINPLSVF